MPDRERGGKILHKKSHTESYQVWDFKIRAIIQKLPALERRKCLKLFHGVTCRLRNKTHEPRHYDFLTENIVFSLVIHEEQRYQHTHMICVRYCVHQIIAGSPKTHDKIVLGRSTLAKSPTPSSRPTPDGGSSRNDLSSPPETSDRTRMIPRTAGATGNSPAVPLTGSASTGHLQLRSVTEEDPWERKRRMERAVRRRDAGIRAKGLAVNSRGRRSPKLVVAGDSESRGVSWGSW